MTEIAEGNLGFLGKVDAKIENKTLILEAPEAGMAFSVKMDIIKNAIESALPEGAVRAIGTGLLEELFKIIP